MDKELSALVADDDQNIRKIICFHLRQEGYKTTEARNGSEALGLARSQHFDVILLDIMMPYMDGLTVCKTLKSDPKTKSSLVIIITARGRKEDVIEAIKVGADDYCIKPFDKELFLQKVKKLTLAKTIKAPTTDRRVVIRASKPITITWKEVSGNKAEIIYKERVIDISQSGLSFEHKRCEVCTGYEKSTVHPLCPLSKYARRFQESETFDFILTLPNKNILQLKGKVAHVFQPVEWPKTEKVGVMFIDLTKEQQSAINKLIA